MQLSGGLRGCGRARGSPWVPQVPLAGDLMTPPWPALASQLGAGYPLQFQGWGHGWVLSYPHYKGREQTPAWGLSPTPRWQGGHGDNFFFLESEVLWVNGEQKKIKKKREKASAGRLPAPGPTAAASPGFEEGVKEE